jgi:tRNA threonylcarbamoyladenosine biosynthesis protein TsaE
VGKFIIFHYDFYRLKSIDEILDLGVLDRLNEGITIIEWPELIFDYIKTNYLKISITENFKNRDYIIEKIILEV